MRVITITSNYAPTIHDQIILVNAVSGAVTVTLPTAADSENLRLDIKKIDASANAVTVTSAQNIDGTASKSLAFQYDSLTFVCSGSTYHII